MLFFSFCLGCLGFTGSPNSNGKKWFRKRLGRGIKHVPQFEGLSLKIVVDIKSFVRQREKKYGLATSNLGFSVYLMLGVKFDLMLDLRSQVFEYCRERS